LISQTVPNQFSTSAGNVISSWLSSAENLTRHQTLDTCRLSSILECSGTTCRH